MSLPGAFPYTAITPAEGRGSSLPALGQKGHSDALYFHEPSCLEPTWCSISLGFHPSAALVKALDVTVEAQSSTCQGSGHCLTLCLELLPVSHQ